MTIQLKSSETIEKQVEFQIPCFYRTMNEQFYIGLLDQNTVVSITKMPGLLMIQNAELWLKEHDLLDAKENWVGCREYEFMEAYAEVEHSMSLNPILVR